MSRHRMVPRSVAVILLTGQLGGCTGWRLESLSPAEVVEQQQLRAINRNQEKPTEKTLALRFLGRSLPEKTNPYTQGQRAPGSLPSTSRAEVSGTTAWM